MITAAVVACGAGPSAPGEVARSSTSALPQATSTVVTSTLPTGPTSIPGSVPATDGGNQPADTASEDFEFAQPPPGLSPVGVVEALGGRLDEAGPPVYPPVYVDACWDGVDEVYYLYMVAPQEIDVAALDPHLGGARLEVVGVDYTRDQLHDWEEQAQTALRDRSVSASVNLSVVVPEWPAAERFCSRTGPYLKVELHEDTPATELAAAFAAVPPELVLVVREDQSAFLSGARDDPGP